MTAEQHAKSIIDAAYAVNGFKPDVALIPEMYQFLPIVADGIRAAVAEEREACAKVADGYDNGDNLRRGSDGWKIAADIRARGANAESRPVA